MIPCTYSAQRRPKNLTELIHCVFWDISLSGDLTTDSQMIPCAGDHRCMRYQSNEESPDPRLFYCRYPRSLDCRAVSGYIHVPGSTENRAPENIRDSNSGVIFKNFSWLPLTERMQCNIWAVGKHAVTRYEYLAPTTAQVTENGIYLKHQMMISMDGDVT